jgi:hypothetical protein
MIAMEEALSIIKSHETKTYRFFPRKGSLYHEAIFQNKEAMLVSLNRESLSIMDFTGMSIKKSSVDRSKT